MNINRRQRYWERVSVIWKLYVGKVPQKGCINIYFNSYYVYTYSKLTLRTYILVYFHKWVCWKLFTIISVLEVSGVVLSFQNVCLFVCLFLCHVWFPYPQSSSLEKDYMWYKIGPICIIAWLQWDNDIYMWNN